jgi:hypothetical protein
MLVPDILDGAAGPGWGRVSDWNIRRPLDTIKAQPATSQCARLEARPYCQRQISALGGLLLGHVITFAICRTYSYDFCRPSYAQIRKRPIGIRRLMT